MSFLDTGISVRMLKSFVTRERISSASLTPPVGSPRKAVTRTRLVSGPGPCRTCAPATDGVTDTASAAASPAAESAKRCETFTVVTSKALTKGTPTCRAGSADRARASSSLHGRRGTRTPDILRVRQALYQLSY